MPVLGLLNISKYVDHLSPNKNILKDKRKLPSILFLVKKSSDGVPTDHNSKRLLSIRLLSSDNNRLEHPTTPHSILPTLAQFSTAVCQVAHSTP